ncbi:12266_t:CDS:2 [Entrophospora sp. SA101]|nr:12266_t:CDS:2 [Entrophospora sp. SA101]
MNSETKRKFCGLIMFDVPIISMKSKNNNDDLANNNSNNNNNTRDINPSSYESLNNISVNGVLGNHHSFTDMLAGLEFQNHYLTNGSVNHGNNGLAANQQQYLH